MDHDEFVAAVKRMREAQRNYFRTRNRQYFDEARDAERQVDAMLRQLEQARESAEQ